MKYIIFTLSLLLSVHATAQNVLNAKSPEELRKMQKEKYDMKLDSMGENFVKVSTKNKPLPYGFIEDKDVLWSKVTWEVIDLNERLNQVYYHTSDGLVSSNNSLFEALRDGIKDGKITEVYDDEFFKVKLSAADAIGRLADIRFDEDGMAEIVNSGKVPDENDIKSMTDTVEIRNDKVRMVMIKGLWYLDKRLGEMKYRLLGIAMLGPDAKTLGKGIAGGDELLPLFWIWYDNARDQLTNYNVFNPDNNSSPITYDDLLNARRFSSIIYRSDSGFADGDIKNYLPKDAKAQLEESNRIKKSILEHENEMWNY